MLSTIKNIIQKEKFSPSFLGFFINYNFLLRKGLKKAISNNSNKLNGVLVDFGCGSKPYKKYFTSVNPFGYFFFASLHVNHS